MKNSPLPPFDIDKLASVQHDIWTHWMKYQFSVCGETQEGDLVIPKEKVDRWKRQMDTPYSNLSDKEKKSDIDQVNKFLHLLPSGDNSEEMSKYQRILKNFKESNLLLNQIKKELSE